MATANVVYFYTGTLAQFAADQINTGPSGYLGTVTGGPASAPDTNLYEILQAGFVAVSQVPVPYKVAPGVYTTNLVGLPYQWTFQSA